jgi:hypothetical protein
MNQLKEFVSDFLKSTNDYADITIDYFQAIKRSIKQGDIEEGNDAGYTYELTNILEVMDQQRFPNDYEKLSQLNELLEALEDLL